MLLLYIRLVSGREVRPIFADQTTMSKDEGAGGMVLQAAEADLQGRGQEAIVGIEKDHVPAPAGLQAHVAGRRGPLVALAEAAHIGIIRRNL